MACGLGFCLGRKFFFMENWPPQYINRNFATHLFKLEK